MLRPLARGLAVSALTAGLAFAAAPAFAITAPPPGTAACTAAVNNDATVQAAVGALNTARTTLLTDQTNGAPAATVAADQTAVDNATNHVTVVRTNAENALCTGTTDTVVVPRMITPAPTTDPTTPPVVPHVRSQAVIDGEIDALSCASSNGDLQVIDRQIAARQVAHQDTSEVVARLNAKLATLSCATGAVTRAAAAQTAHDCGCVTVTKAPVVTGSVTSGGFTAKTVVPTADNGSVAASSSAADVPAGSVSTGAE